MYSWSMWHSSKTAVSHSRLHYWFFVLCQFFLLRFCTKFLLSISPHRCGTTMSRKNPSDYHNGYRSASSVCQTLLHLLKVLGFILFYWCCSISLTFFNRHLFRDYKFPLFITTLHMVIKFLFAALIRVCLHRSSCYKSCGQHPSTDRERVNLTWPILWRKVAPTGTIYLT